MKKVRNYRECWCGGKKGRGRRGGIKRLKKNKSEIDKGS